jgi:penicillin-insensitive murein endopeptidase
MRVEPSPTLRVRNPSQAYGTEELVALITWAAEEVARQHPGSSLNVGDLSRERGGRIRPHRSHRVGRDADLGFYLVDGQSGAPAEARHFVALPRGAKGTDRQGGSFAFDDARNWTLIAALVSQDVVPVQYIMVIAPLKERLLAEGRRRGASPELLARVEAVVGPQRSGRGRFAYDSHDSHFHVRIYCAPDDRPACVDTAPFHPWVSREAVEPPRPQRARARRPARRAASRQARRR